MEALTLVHEQKFDVVLLDPGCAGTRGLDTVHGFLERAGDLPILVLVDPLDKTLALGAVELGAVDYVIKGKIDATLPSLIRHAAEQDYRPLERKTTFSPARTILGAFVLSGFYECSRLLRGEDALHWVSYTITIVFGGLVLGLAAYWMIRLDRRIPDAASISPILPETSSTDTPLSSAF